MLFNLLLVVNVCVAMPMKGAAKMENYLDTFLDLYYEENVAPEKVHDDGVQVETFDEEEMQGDQPVADPKNANTQQPQYRVDNNYNADLIRKREREKDGEGDRNKNIWKDTLKRKLLEQLGRTNSTNISNVTQFLENYPKGMNQSEDTFITEKTRSFYPLCEIPKVAEQEMWKDSNSMNLYFNFEQIEGDIVTATLRLHRILAQNATSSTDNSFEGHSDDEKLLRITIYYFTKSPRKNKAKRKICDSKVVSFNSKWIDLSVLPATKAWAKGRNLGLALQVEDQDGEAQKADTLFKGPACMVGSSTPKPIPSILFDPTRATAQLDRINSFMGPNATSPINFNPPMFPTIDICTVQVPANHTAPINLSSLRTCNVRPLQLEPLKTQLFEQLQMPARHIRHQRQHHEKTRQPRVDPRSQMVGTKVIFTNAEVQNMTRFKR